MRIVNSKAEDIEACCVFSYKGYKVSASTIAQPNAVLVYRDEEGERSTDLFETYSIPLAMEHIDSVS